MLGVLRSRIIAMSLVVLLFASLFPFLGIKPFFKSIEASHESFIDPLSPIKHARSGTDLDGRIFYVTENNALSICVSSHYADFSVASMPPGASLSEGCSGDQGTPGNFNWTFTWTPRNVDLSVTYNGSALSGIFSSSNPYSADNPPTAPFGATFIANRTTSFNVTNSITNSITNSTTADIVIVVMSAVEPPPDPEIELDRATYTFNDVPRIRIKDPYALCNYNTQEPATDRLRLRAQNPQSTEMQGSAPISIPHRNARASDQSGELEANIALSEMPLNSAVVARLVGGLNVIAEYSRFPSGCDPDGDSIGGRMRVHLPIRLIGIDLDKSQYTLQDVVTATVSAVIPPVPGIPLPPPSLGNNVTAEIFDETGRSINGSREIAPSAQGANTYLIDLKTFSDPANEATELRITYGYNYTGAPAALQAASHAAILQRALQFDNLQIKNFSRDNSTGPQDNSTGYYSDQGVALTVTDPARNTNRDLAENLDLGFTSIFDGNTESGTIPQFLVETGPDTGIFVNQRYLYFTRGGGPAAPGPSVPISPSKDINTNMYLCVQSVGCDTTGTVSDPLANTTIWPVESRYNAEGTGSTGASLVPGDPYNSPNSVQLFTCSNHGGDSDGDGLCDNWEYPNTGGPLKIPHPEGSTPFTVGTCSMPALAGCPHKQHDDIFLEVDRVGEVSSTELSAALDNVRIVFDEAPISNDYGGTGIKLHYIVDESIGAANQCANTLDNMDVWDSTSVDDNDYDFQKGRRFGTASERNNVFAPNDTTMAKFQGYHWVFFGCRQATDSGSSGAGEIIGNDIIVTLQNHDEEFSVDGMINNRDQMQGTLLHELGHNLGLYHGGPNSYPGYNVNCKPNYVSVMTYTRQMTSAYTVGNIQRYSDNNMGPNNIDWFNNGTGSLGDGLYDRKEGSNYGGQVLRLGTASAFPWVIIVWNVDPASSDYPTANVTRTTNQLNPNVIDWKSDGIIEPENPEDTLDPINFDASIPGCTLATNGHKERLYGANDWPAITANLNFREINPTNAGTGFSPAGYNVGEELDNATFTGVLAAGIKSLFTQINVTRPLDFAPSYAVYADDIKDEFYDRLINEGSDSTSDFVECTSSLSVVDLIKDGELEEAIAKLACLRVYTDHSRGGLFQDDYFTDPSTTLHLPDDPPTGHLIVNLLDNNLAALQTALAKPFADNGGKTNLTTTSSFKTYHGNCAGLASDPQKFNKYCVITMIAPTMANTTSTFSLQADGFTIDVIGQGPYDLIIPAYLVNGNATSGSRNIAMPQVKSVTEQWLGHESPFTYQFDDQTDTLILNVTENPLRGNYNERLVKVVTVPEIDASLGIERCGGSYREVWPILNHFNNDTSHFYVTVENNLAQDRDVELLFSIDPSSPSVPSSPSKSTTVVLNAQAGTDVQTKNVPGHGKVCFTINWTQHLDAAEGDYDAKIILRDADNKIWMSTKIVPFYVNLSLK